MFAFLASDDEHHRIAIAGIPGLEEQSMTAAGTDHIETLTARPPLPAGMGPFDMLRF